MRYGAEETWIDASIWQVFTRTVSTEAFRRRKLPYYKLNTRAYAMWILDCAAAGLIWQYPILAS